MAETEPTAAAPAAEASAPADGAAPAGEGKENGKRRNREDQVPIEELYDLSKPIPRVEKPNKDEHDKLLASLTEEIDKLKEEKQKLQTEIESAMEAGKSPERTKEREALQQLRNSKGKLIGEKKVIRAKLDALRSASDKLVKDRKDTRSNVKFGSVDEIDKEIKRLQRRQETTSMSLQEEKKLIKELDALKASKTSVESLKSKESDLEDIKEQKKTISAQLTDKDKEIDAITKQIEEKQAAMKAMNDKDSEKRGKLNSLFEKREEYKKSISEKIKSKDEARTTYREANNKWYDYQRAIRAQRKMQYEAEQAKREEERQAFLKKKEEEELKKEPYEEEQGLCDYLADYLERTYLSKGDGSSSKVAAKKDDVIAVKDDPFANFKPVKRNDDEEYFGKGKGKKKRNRPTKKPTAGPFTLNVDTFEQFGLIGLSPPTSLDGVEKSVKELREKKEWFAKQPRGSVPTASEIRKANEKAANKFRQGSVNGSAPSASTDKGKFSLSSDDFAPLGKGASSNVDSSSWGQKGAASDEPVPADAAAAEATEE